jgi:integrase
MRKLLTATFLESVKSPASGRLEVSDTRCSGLAFRMTVGGEQSWSFRFRDPESGRTCRFKVGNYPDMSLKTARAAVDELRTGVGRGINPQELRKRERRERTERSFGALVTRYIENAKTRKRSWSEDQRLLLRHALPAWQYRKADAITRLDVVELVDTLVASGTLVEANRLQTVLGSVFAHGVDEGTLAAHPSSRLKMRGGKEKPRKRVLSDDEIRFFWPHVVETPISHRVGTILRLLLLSGCRAREIAWLNRSEVFHLGSDTEAHLLLPEERVKTGRAFYVPLTGLALSELREAWRSSNSQWVFPGRSGERPVRVHTLGYAMKRFCEHHAGSWLDDRPKPHDLRRTLRTNLTALGVPSEHAREVLNHAKVGVDDRVYNVYAYSDEKRAVLAAWSAKVEAIIRGK